MNEERIPPRILALLFILALGLFAYGYMISPFRPGATTPEGWFGWFDQSVYLRQARYLSAGDLPPRGDYVYGLGYPLLGVPSLWAGIEVDPFLVPNALAFAGVVVSVAVVGARLRSWRFGLVCAGAVALATPLLEFMVVPWGTTVSVVATAVVLLFAARDRPLSAVDGAVVGLAVSWAFAARYVDGVFLAIPAAVVLAHRASRRSLLAGAGAAAIVVALVLWSHAAIFGHALRTPYSQHLDLHGRGISDQDIRAYDPGRIPRSFVEVFVTGSHEGERQPRDPLGARFTWGILAPVGVALLVIARHRFRAMLASAFAASLVASAFYLGFRGGTGGNLKFHNIRYFVMWFPVWGLLAAYAAARLADSAVAAVTSRRRLRPVEERDDR